MSIVVVLEQSTIAVAAPGPQGPPGPPGDGAQHTHTQAIAAAEWIVNHNFGRSVSGTVYNAAGEEIVAHVIATSENQLRVYLNAPQTGKVLVV